MRVRECHCDFPIETNQGPVSRCAKCLGVIRGTQLDTINVYNVTVQEFIDKVIAATKKNVVKWRLASGGFYAPAHENAYIAEITPDTIVVTEALIEIHGILGMNDKWVVSRNMEQVRIMNEAIHSSLRNRWTIEIQLLTKSLDGEMNKENNNGR